MEDIKLSADGRVILPQPDELSKREKEDAMGAYLMMFAAWGIGLPFPFLSLIAAFIYHMINRKKSRFVAFHSYQSLLTETLISILNAVLIIWFLVILVSSNIFKQGTSFHLNIDANFYIYLIFVIFWNIVYTVVSLIGCFKAKNGKFYYFLVFGRIAFNAYYGKRAQLKMQRQKNIKAENKPPDGF
ncbi:MAG: DUF4870 domain-containing protein [Spirochaetales bacterium]|nr:DUF4870 domain-containing protein [Spirochaetales bacterium]